jgi:dihydropteroate synthase
MGHHLALPKLLGILNTTPDSFSDGGLYETTVRAVDRAGVMLMAGADWIDVGGESTRPGSATVDAVTEMGRVVPVIQEIIAKWPDAQVSIDTSKAQVARAAIAAGAKMVNDVSAMSDPEMAEVVASSGVKVVLMHMRGTPRTMTSMTEYTDLVGEVASYLQNRADAALAAGIAKDAIILDPGVGFGKAIMDNARLIRGISTLRSLGYPILIGASRKRFIGEITGVTDASERVAGSIGAAIAATALGAEMLRVHDVAQTKHALQLYLAITTAE